MFYHDKRLQYYTKPDQPDPLYARKLQEVLGGQFGEVSVMMQYLFQGWSCRGDAKYRDMLMDTGTEEIAHVEMLATLIAQLLEGAPVEHQETAAKHPVIGAVMGGASVTPAILAGMNPQHQIVTGLGAQAADSNGTPWNAGYIVASGNLLADFRANLNAESQGRLQVARLYHMTDDAGVRDTLQFLLARDTMHQNQWVAAIQDLEASGYSDLVVPGEFPRAQQKNEVAYQFWNLSAGEQSAEGRWAKGQAPDGKGQFEYVPNPAPLGPEVMLSPTPSELYDTDQQRPLAGAKS